MAERTLARAAEILNQCRCVDDLSRGCGAWSTLVETVASHAGASRSRLAKAEALAEPPFDLPRSTATATPGQLEAALEALHLKKAAAGWLKRLSKWWLQEFGPAPEQSGRWRDDGASLNRSLRAVAGVPRLLVEKILLLVGNQPVMPTDRKLMRVVGRHGWLEPGADYEEWQAYFKRGLGEAGAPHARFWRQLSQVGQEFCKASAHCEQCPLRGLLPPGGPIDITDAGP
jgi:endonuclease III